MSLLSKEERANGSPSHNTNQSADPLLQFWLFWSSLGSVCFQIRKADWVASYRQSKRIVLFHKRIPLFPVLAQINARVHKKETPPDTPPRTDAVTPFSLKHPERTGLTRKIGK